MTAADVTSRGVTFATLRIEAIRHLTFYGPATADEIATKLGESVLAMRPRLTELFKSGAITWSGKRPNRSGRLARVWRLAS